MYKACLVVPLGSACSKSAESRSMWSLDEECQRWPGTSEPPDGLGSIKGPSERYQPDTKGSIKRTKQTKGLKLTRKKLIMNHTVQQQEKMSSPGNLSNQVLGIERMDMRYRTSFSVSHNSKMCSSQLQRKVTFIIFNAGRFKLLNDFFYWHKSHWTYKFTNNSVFF